MTTDDVAYDLTSALIPLIFFIGGLMLVIAGRRNRRAVAEPTSQSPEEQAAATGPEPDLRRPRRGRIQVALGVLLVVMASLVTVSLATREVHRTIAMPPSVLGLSRDADVSQEGAAALVAALGDGHDATMGVYGRAGEPSLTVVAATGRFTEPADAIDEISDVLATQQGLRLKGGQDVDPGPLGGIGHCWSTTVKGSNVQMCVLADRGSVLLVLDATATSITHAAERARQVRNATIT